MQLNFLTVVCPCVPDLCGMLQLSAHSLAYCGDVKTGRCLLPKTVPCCWAFCQLAWWVTSQLLDFSPTSHSYIFFILKALENWIASLPWFFFSQDWLLSKMLSSHLPLYLLSPKISTWALFIKKFYSRSLLVLGISPPSRSVINSVAHFYLEY